MHKGEKGASRAGDSVKPVGGYNANPCRLPLSVQNPNYELVSDLAYYFYPFEITSLLFSIRIVSCSLGLNGNKLSVTSELGRLTLWRDPTLYIFILASLTMYIHRYSNQCIKTYIHTLVYTKVWKM